MKKIRFKKISLIYLLLILVFVSAYFLYDAHIQEYRWGKLHSAIEEELKDFRIEASVIIKDLKKERMINIDPDELIPSASLVKIPIMLACFDAARNGGINLTDQIVLEKRHKVDGSGNLKKLQAGEIFSVQTLIELMITESDNTATNMLIELLGFDYLNTKFKNMGLEDTNISRLMMDMKSRDEGIENYTTAFDTAFLLEKIYRKRTSKNSVWSRCLEVLKKQKAKDRIPAKLPPDTVVAHKTGLEKGICHDVGIVFTDKGDFLICILTRHNNKNSWPSKLFIANATLQTYNYYKNR